MIDRRSFNASALLSVGALAAGTVSPALARDRPVDMPRKTNLPALFDDIEERAFRWFWDTGNPANGLVPDSWPDPAFCSIAAVGFALTAYPVGVARGWITRAAARARTLATLRFFASAPQGDAVDGVSGHRGFFYHFLHMDSGLRFGGVELSSVDSSLLFLGMLFAAEYYDQDHPDEREIRRLATAIYERADWNWFRRGQPTISMGWQPGTGFIARNWDGYNEGMMVNLLALGSPTHAVGPETWDAWCAPYSRCWRGSGATRRLAFAPEIVVPATLAMHARYGDWVYGKYGFYDAFNPSFRVLAKPVQRGAVDPVRGWVSQNYLGIDQGPILGAIANTRDDFIWRAMHRSAPIRRGLQRAGFTGGWLEA